MDAASFGGSAEHEGAAAPLQLASVGLRDSFYQFKNTKLASWFCIGLECTAGELGLTEVFDEDADCSVPVGPDTVLWPAFEGVAMG
eukprot:3862086-Lingulodinium_polyedra.AAC.1